MEGEFYDVTFDGTLLPGHELGQVKDNLAQIFKVNKQKIEPYFSNKHVVVKEKVTKDIADRYIAAFKMAGAQCILSHNHQPVGTHQEVSPQVKEEKIQENMTNRAEVNSAAGTAENDKASPEKSFLEKSEASIKENNTDNMDSTSDETNQDLNNIFSRLYSSKKSDNASQLSELYEAEAKDDKSESIESDLFNDYLKESNKDQNSLYDDNLGSTTEDKPEESFFSDSENGESHSFDNPFGDDSEIAMEAEPEESLFSDSESGESNSFDNLFGDDSEPAIEVKSDESLFTDSNNETKDNDTSLNDLFGSDIDEEASVMCNQTCLSNSDSNIESDDTSLDHLFADDSYGETAHMFNDSVSSDQNEDTDNVTQPIAMSQDIDEVSGSDKTQRMTIPPPMENADTLNDKHVENMHYHEDEESDFDDLVEESDASELIDGGAAPAAGSTYISADVKEKSIAIKLAVLLGPLTWLYSFEKDALKFWISAGASIILGVGAMVLNSFIGGLLGTIGLGVFLLWALGAWIWPLIDTIKRSDDFYSSLNEDGKLGIVSLLSPLLIPLPVISGCTAVFFGLSHLSRIKKSEGTLSGRRSAIAGIIVGALSVILFMVFFFSIMSKIFSDEKIRQSVMPFFS